MQQIVKLLLLSLVLHASLAFGAITEVASQRAQNDSAASVASMTIAFPNNVTAGNLVCVGGSMYTGSVFNTIAVTDSRSTSYSVYLNDAGGLGGAPTYSYIACGKVPTSGSNTVTLTPSVSAYLDAAIDEFTGQDSSAFLDVDGGSSENDTATTSGVASVTFSTVAANALVLGAMTQTTPGTTSITEAGGWTKIGEQEDNGCCSAFSFIFKIVSGAGSQTPSWTIGDTGGYLWLTYAISIKPSAGGVGVVRHRPIVMQ